LARFLLLFNIDSPSLGRLRTKTITTNKLFTQSDRGSFAVDDD